MLVFWGSIIVITALLELIVIILVPIIMIIEYLYIRYKNNRK